MAQQKPTDLDKSPMDVSYFPANYPITKMRGQANGDPLARVIYSRPQKKGREIFGEEVKYNDVWRLGANEATELELFKNASIGGKKIPKGRYTLYCIPTEAKWTIVINRDNYSWGSFTYKADKDIARVDVPVQKTADNVEALSMYFDANSLIIQWENLKVAVPFTF
ncbi:hypothetical protein SAE01_19050 [Segetibacter aerophilus]|uniref:DUF2911 domain-containing protein n=2 Tax=Segetibacter aerophilus TaxID=670293 RepID=A0A512BBR1_9BACT|nr:hypothetical protein SAE01_19050 [Segetibacter aerophilus]